jgi:hypothetical protein
MFLMNSNIFVKMILPLSLLVDEKLPNNLQTGDAFAGLRPAILEKPHLLPVLYKTFHNEFSSSHCSSVSDSYPDTP